MREIEDEVRRARRIRLVAHGAASDYADPQVYASVDEVLRRAIDQRDRDALLMPELVGDERERRLETHLTFASHRPLTGGAIIFFKRRVLLPLMRWLYEYSLENFRRQQRINTILFAAIEELAIENAKLKKEIAELQNGRMTPLQDGRIAGLQD